MTDYPLNTVPSTDLAAPEDAAAAGPRPPTGKLHRLLRGRYVWAVVLGLLGAAAGVAGGYKALTPMYTSTGLVKVNPVLPRVMYTTENSQVMPMFDYFVDEQVQLMQSPRVLNQAMVSDELRSLGWGMSPEAVEAFRDALQIDRAKRSTVVIVGFTAESADTANAAVKAVIDAYRDIFVEKHRKDNQDRLSLLDTHRTKLMNEISGLTSRIAALGEKYWSDDLDDIYKAELKKLGDLEQSLIETRLDMINAGLVVDANDPNGQRLVDEKAREMWQSMSVQEIAAKDPHMRKLIEERRSLDRSIELKRTQFVDKHPEVQALLKVAATLQAEIDAYAKEYRDKGPDRMRAATAEKPDGTATAADLPALQAKRKVLEEEVKKLKDRTAEMGKTNMSMITLKEERTSSKEHLQQTKDRIDALNLESTISGRIEVISDGHAPPTPSNDGKRKQLAALGFLAGGGVGVGIVLLVGYRDRRLRDSEDAELSIGRVPVLGLLPQLPDDLADPENVVNACYAVHHIRTMLQLGTNGSPSHVVAVTGPVPQTGKTSLTLALGLSFASSGSRTLLIDADVGGGGLTHRLQAMVRHRLGQILRRRGLVNTHELQEALRMAQSQSKRVGETLLEMGVLSEDELAEALHLQNGMRIGLLDALKGEPLENCTTDTGIANMSVLPIGGAQVYDMSRVSPATMRNLIEGARSRFDVVLIDTGPVPYAPASGVAASTADQTVLVISRGDQRGPAEKAVEFLQSIGVRLAGVVFNRAGNRDIERSNYSSGVSASHRFSGTSRAYGSARPMPNRERTLPRSERFDPVTRAVAAASAVGDEGETETGLSDESPAA